MVMVLLLYKPSLPSWSSEPCLPSGCGPCFGVGRGSLVVAYRHVQLHWVLNHASLGIGFDLHVECSVVLGISAAQITPDSSM